MADCNFNISFTSPAQEVYEKAKKTVESQGGTFTGDLNAGNFSISVFGNDISGSYTVEGNNMNILIEEKPFLVPCSMIESFLKMNIA